MDFSVNPFANILICIISNLTSGGIEVYEIPSGSTMFVSEKVNTVGVYQGQISAFLQGTRYQASNQIQSITDSDITFTFALTPVSG